MIISLGCLTGGIKLMGGGINRNDPFKFWNRNSNETFSEIPKVLKLPLMFRIPVSFFKHLLLKVALQAKELRFFETRSHKVND